MNASQLASYDYFKSTLLKIQGTRDGPVLQFGASFLAGTVATNVVKSRVMAAKSSAETILTLVFLEQLRLGVDLWRGEKKL
ncbi:hypothetical protein QFC19_003398 [Naganishia cerealis]|uniref:Uncharacterized protein n=1 Tax=Naganishia cerealis TaxID=610337 RepID=A0ACC2W358_9TREE|nr:hypothetical protein QFC19_003398 [Naganishia cerealis]